MDKEDKEGGLLKRLKNIKNAQKKLDKSEYDEDEEKKTERDINQGSIEGMKGLKLPGETESKDEESQMYLKNNLNQIKNFFFFDIYDKYQRFFDHITDEEKKSIDYKTLSFKVKGINFFNNYGTLYE